MTEQYPFTERPFRGARARFGRTLRYYEICDSTQDRAIEAAAEGSPEGALFVAGSQERGRGRGGRPWFSVPGCLMFSVILRPQVEPGILGGLAVLLSGEAAKVLQDLTHLPIKVKWPNDIIYEDRKLGGLIIEGAARRSDADVFILGAGININVRSRDFPGEIRRTAASVRDIAGEEVDEERLLALILRSFERLYGAILRRGTSPYLRSMRNISTLGRKVRIETEKETVTGTALRLTDRGALVMRIDGGMEREFLSALKLTEL